MHLPYCEKSNVMSVNVKFFKLMGTDVPIVFSAGSISKWLNKIDKSEADIIQSLTAMNNHEICQLIYAGMEYGYGIQGVGRCPYTFYEVEEYILETMQPDNRMDFEDLLIYAVECVTGRVDRMAKKNGIDLNSASFAQTMRENWNEMYNPKEPEVKPKAKKKTA